MELEDLDSISKNDFLPLLQFNIKQELLDHNVVGTATGTGGGVDSDVDMGAVMVTANSSSGSNSGGGGGGNMNNGNSLGTASGPGESAGAGESIGNLCDSVQKQVRLERPLFTDTRHRKYRRPCWRGHRLSGERALGVVLRWF